MYFTVSKPTPATILASGYGDGFEKCHLCTVRISGSFAESNATNAPVVSPINAYVPLDEGIATSNGNTQQISEEEPEIDALINGIDAAMDKGFQATKEIFSEER